MEEAIQDFVDSCIRQGIFNSKQILREFLNENYNELQKQNIDDTIIEDLINQYL